MALEIVSRVRSAWNAFWNARDQTFSYREHVSSHRPDRTHYTFGTERTIIASIFNRIAVDVSSSNIRHVKLDDNGRFKEIVNDGLNKCLSVEANTDQTGRALMRDAALSLLDEGCIAIVPVDTTSDPNINDSYDILSIRVGKIVEWSPYQVKIDIYNENVGEHEQIWLDKKYVGIVENPFYVVMNQPNSTMKRLVRKLNLLDKIDSDIGANKLNLIIQLPYMVKGEAKRKQANERRKDIQDQLSESVLGVAYIDGTEKVVQLNRPIENTLLGQVEYLTNQVYGQLGIDESILNGTADEKVMNNYNNRIVDPILLAITEEMDRKFLTKTARTQGHAIRYFMDPFRLLPISSVPEVADKLTRNEILTGNEIRQIIGIKPSSDPKADELRNKNLNSSKNVDITTSLERSVMEMIKKLEESKNKSNKNQNEE